MKTVLVLFFIFAAAFAAPAEDQKKAPEAPVVKKEEAAAPEFEDKMMKKEEELPVPENSIIVPGNAPVPKKAEGEHKPVLKKAEGPESRLMCPTGWVSFQQRCYLFVPSNMDWQDAEKFCRVFGAHLTSATSVEEYTFLQQLTTNAGQNVAWMGGFYMSKWMWMANEDYHYTYWHSKSSSSRNCMYLQTNAGWGSGSCTSSYNFICSY